MLKVLTCHFLHYTKHGLEESQELIHKIKITFSSKNVQNVEKVCINQYIDVEMSSSTRPSDVRDIMYF